MKKIIAIVALTFILFLTGCNNSNTTQHSEVQGTENIQHQVSKKRRCGYKTIISKFKLI